MMDLDDLPAFRGDDINRLTAIVYDELHKVFKDNPTLVVLGHRWVCCTDEFQRSWEEAIHRALVRSASGEGEHGPTALVLKTLLNRTMKLEPDFYTLAGVLLDELMKRYEYGTGLPTEMGKFRAESTRTDLPQQREPRR
jgi:hypothetical protein